jgi:hypothetical protein
MYREFGQGKRPLGDRAVYDKINIKIGYSLDFRGELVRAGWKQDTLAGYVNSIIITNELN